MSHPYLSEEEEEAVFEAIRSQSNPRYLKNYPTNDDLRQARLYHDLDIWEEGPWYLFAVLIKIVSIDPRALPAVDSRPYFPPPYYSLIPFVNDFKRWRDKKENYYPFTVQELLDACRPTGWPDTCPDNFPTSVGAKIIWRWTM